jgi:ABC-type nitrate/sulfonate/bicarbonate transport system ATPase subunit
VAATGGDAPRGRNSAGRGWARDDRCQAADQRFGTEAAPAVALLYIEFSISEGELVVVVGPSGCGKSTPLRVLAGQLPQSEGEARLHGTPIGGPRRDIGVVFQAPVLLPWRSVLGNPLLPGRCPAPRPRQDARAPWTC